MVTAFKGRQTDRRNKEDEISNTNHTPNIMD